MLRTSDEALDVVEGGLLEEAVGEVEMWAVCLPSARMRRASALESLPRTARTSRWVVEVALEHLRGAEGGARLGELQCRGRLRMSGARLRAAWGGSLAPVACEVNSLGAPPRSAARICAAGRAGRRFCTPPARADRRRIRKSCTAATPQSACRAR